MPVARARRVGSRRGRARVARAREQRLSPRARQRRAAGGRCVACGRDLQASRLVKARADSASTRRSERRGCAGQPFRLQFARWRSREYQSPPRHSPCVSDMRLAARERHAAGKRVRRVGDAGRHRERARGARWFVRDCRTAAPRTAAPRRAAPRTAAPRTAAPRKNRSRPGAPSSPATAFWSAGPRSASSPSARTRWFATSTRCRPSQTFVDHLGREHAVDPRHDIFAHRIMIHLKGWIGRPEASLPDHAVDGEHDRSEGAVRGRSAISSIARSASTAASTVCPARARCSARTRTGSATTA